MLGCSCDKGRWPASRVLSEELEIQGFFMNESYGFERGGATHPQNPGTEFSTRAYRGILEF